MITRIYTIYDKVAEEAGPPFTAVNNGVAARQFRSILKDSPYSDEYQLYLIGEYDSATMRLNMLPENKGLPVEVDLYDIDISIVPEVSNA